MKEEVHDIPPSGNEEQKKVDERLPIYDEIKSGNQQEVLLLKVEEPVLV